MSNEVSSMQYNFFNVIVLIHFILFCAENISVENKVGYMMPEYIN